MPKILIIDDNPAVSTALDVLLSLRNIDTAAAASPAEGMKRLARGGIDLVIADMNFETDTTSGEEGVALFHSIRAAFPELPIILLTAWTHLEAAVSLVKAGAADYLAKPWDDEKLLVTVSNLLELSSTRQTLSAQQKRADHRRSKLASSHDLRGLVFADAAMEQVVHLACQFAKSDLPVLITGPNGCGKEKLAELIHANSPAASGKLVAVNCGALPAELIEAELFGAETGAYTGANQTRVGKFEAADGGTLFLDEIGTLPPEGQAKLLRVLETGRFSRLGSNREQQVQVRVVSATNADLPAMIQAGDFREDLFYRLNTLELRVPALAERPDDIQPLAEHFLAGRKALATQARLAMQGYAWPGNVRELRNVIERAALLTTSETISASDLNLPSHARASDSNELTVQAIEAALAQHDGVIAQAAASLGLSRQSLYRRMDKLGIKRS